MAKKINIINANVKHWIHMDQMNDTLKDMLKKKYRSYWLNLQREIKVWGAKKITIGLNKNFKPVQTHTSLV